MAELCYIGQIGLAEGEKPLRKVQVLRKGTFYHPAAPQGKLVIDDALLDELHRNFKSGVRGKELPTNEGHQDPNFRRSPAWIKDLERKPDGLYGVLEFTDEEFLRDVDAGKIKYFSAEIAFDWQNPEDGQRYNVIKGGAFTNLPYIKRMEPVSMINLSEFPELEIALSCDISNAVRRFEKAAKNADPQVYNTQGFKWEFDQLYAAAERFGHRLGDDAPGTHYNRFMDELRRICERLCASGLRLCAEEWAAKLRQEANKTLDEQVEINLASEEMERDKRRMKNASAPPAPPAANPKSMIGDVDPGQDDEPLSTRGAQEKKTTYKKPQQERLADAEDPDAMEADLPLQCMSCHHLFEGTCPFQGVEVKVAAAGDGTCPQYVPHDHGTMEYGVERSPSPSERETKLKEPKMETVSLQEHQQVKAEVEKLKADLAAREEQLTTLSETLTVQGNMLKQEQEARLAAEESRAVDAFVSSGKLTAAQANIVRNLRAAIRNGGEVKLSENGEEKTRTAVDLLNELVESIEPATSLTESYKNGEVAKAHGAPKSGSSEHELLLEEYEKVAKERNIPLGEAARLVLAARAKNKEGQ